MFMGTKLCLNCRDAVRSNYDRSTCFRCGSELTDPVKFMEHHFALVSEISTEVNKQISENVRLKEMIKTSSGASCYCTCYSGVCKDRLRKICTPPVKTDPQNP